MPLLVWCLVVLSVVSIGMSFAIQNWLEGLLTLAVLAVAVARIRAQWRSLRKWEEERELNGD